MPRKKRTAKSVETLTHEEASRKNLPSAEHQPLMRDEEQSPIRLAYERRNRDLDPQLVWRGKDAQDWSDLVVNVPPLYIQERVHPKALIDDLVRISVQRPVAGGQEDEGYQSSFADFFADFNGLPSAAATTEFYQHDANWSNRMILGDSLQVMASLAEREGLRGKVQCIYLDPPYGIKFNSNFQWSTTSRDVRDGNRDHVTREPEQVKAFRDTWRDGIHSYLTYLRDRLTVARDLLTESGSIFVQIGDENVHRVRALMDEVFGEDNFVIEIKFRTTSNRTAEFLPSVFDSVIVYAKDREKCKFHHILLSKEYTDVSEDSFGCIEVGEFEWRRLSKEEKENPRETERKGALFGLGDVTSSHEYIRHPFDYQGQLFDPKRRYWSTSLVGLTRLARANRLCAVRETLRYKRIFNDTPAQPITNLWTDTSSGSRTDDRVYVVQTMSKVIQRCILMTTDPGDLVLDPTCGSGTTAYVAEQWGRRWITIDTSRVALALARARIMGARYPFYLLADSPEGQAKEAELTGRAASEAGTFDRIRQGFVYERVPHVTLRAIANNAEIDVIWEEYEEELAPLRQQLSEASGQWSANSGEGDSSLSTDNRPLEEWEIPRERPEDWPTAAEPLLADFWDLRIARQQAIDASIARNADYEYLYDKPYADRHKVRVAGPFTVESISPHRVLAVDENDEFVEGVAEPKGEYGETLDFASLIIDNLRTSGVQQAHKEDRISFTSVTPWPGAMVCAEGLYTEGGTDDGVQRRAAIFIGPEFGTVSRADLVDAAREAADGNFDVLISCAFNYEAHSTEFERLGKIPVLKARMNPDLHMADELKNTGNGNLFVIFGEPDVTVSSGQWLEDRSGRMLAEYGLVKELSGLESLAEINEAGGRGLSDLCEIPAGRTLRDDQPDSASRGVGGGEDSGRSGTSREGGVSAVSGDSRRIAGGDGDISHFGSAVGNGTGRRGEPPVGSSGGGWSDAQRTQALAALRRLTPASFPLALTTDHWLQVTVNGVDVFVPNSGDMRSDEPNKIPCWFIDTDYNGESFFVRHAYFPGTNNDPYKSLKTTLKAEINREAWESLRSDISRPFDRPESGRIAVKVINHLGDEVMKVFRV